MPQFYLRRFGVDEKVWVVDFQSDKPPYVNGVINTLCIGDFYTVQTPRVEDDDRVEQLLSRVEAEAKPVLDGLLDRMTIPSGEAKASLDAFLATLFLRGPHFRQLQLELYEGMVKILSRMHFSDETVFDRCWEDFKAERSNIDMTKEQARKVLDDSTIEGHISNESYVMSFLKSLPRMFAIFRAMTANVWWANPRTSARFITSDFPFVIEDKSTGIFGMPPNGGLFSSNVRVYVTISPFVCLTLEYDQGGNVYPVLDDSFVPIINSQLAISASRYVVSASKDIYWFKEGRIHRSSEELQKEFYPKKLHTPLLGRSSHKYAQPVVARRDWNKLRGDKPRGEQGNRH